MDVSVIIVNRNSSKLLYDSLKSVEDTTSDVEFEIIVVDNNSLDDSVEMVTKNFPKAKLIVNDTNFGFAAASNQGIKVSQGKYVLLLKSGTILTKGAIDKNITFADQYPNAAVFAPRAKNDNGQVDMTCFCFPNLGSLFFNVTGLDKAFEMNRFFGCEKMLWWPRDTFRKVDVVSDNYMLVRKKAVEQVGMMDPNLFFNYKEADWCYRFSKAGWKTLFNPEVVITVRSGENRSCSNAALKMFVQQQKSCLLYYKKHKGRVKTFIARIILALGYAGRSSYWSALVLYRNLVASQTRHQMVNKLKNQAALKYLLFGIEP